MTEFERQVAEILYHLYAHGPRGRLSAVMLQKYFAPRVAAAIEAAAESAYESSGKPIDRERWMHEAALLALRGAVGVRSPADTGNKNNSGVGGLSDQETP